MLISQYADDIQIAGRPKAAFLIWFFGDFGCGVSLFIVIRVIYIDIGKIDVKC